MNNITLTQKDISVGNIYSTIANEKWECIACEIYPQQHIPERKLIINSEPIFEFVNLLSQQHLVGTMSTLPQFIEQWTKE